jgi:hypothetical protein
MRYDLYFAQILLTAWLVVPAFAADDPPAQQPTVQVRIVGLCSPDRQQDLRETVLQVPELTLAALDYEAAEATIRYDDTKLFGSPAPKQGRTAEQILARVDERLRTASRGTFSAKPRSALPADKQTKVEIEIGLLDCKGCRFGAYQAVAKIDGALRVTVDSAVGLITAWIDPAKTSRDALEAALTQARVPLKGAPATP